MPASDCCTLQISRLVCSSLLESCSRLERKAQVGEPDPQLTNEGLGISGPPGEPFNAAVSAGARHLRKWGFEGIPDDAERIEAGDTDRSDLGYPEPKRSGFLIHATDGNGLRNRSALSIEHR